MNQNLSDISTPIEEEPQPDKLRAFFREMLETIILALILFLIINTFTARIRVEGSSMLPSLNHNNYVIVNRMAYRFGDIERGDVVVFEFPHNKREDYIKRVIALPGEKIEISNSFVYINGQPIQEPYIMAPLARDYPATTVPPEMIYVMGDNRNDSSDSRRWGALSVGDIIGKAVFVYWPFSDFGVVEHYDYTTP
jgi:signal peptidase I